MADQEMVLDGSESTFVWRKSYLRKNWWLVKDGNIIASIKIGNIVKVKATGFYNHIHFNVVQQSRSYYRIEFMREGVTIREGAFLFDQGNPITIRLEIKKFIG